MKNILIIENQNVTLISNVDDGTNRLLINGNEIPYNDWIGTGTYTYDSVVINKASSTALSGNLALKEVSVNEYAFTNSAPFKELTFDDVYPVGSIYLSVNNVNPSTLFGGTWEQIKDKFLLGAGDTYSSGSTGGESTHTLTINEMPSHSHKYNLAYSGNDPARGFNYGNTSVGVQGPGFIQNTGGNQPHNNMPPYLTIMIWKRTA